MTFEEFLQTLHMYYRNCVKPYYSKRAGQPDFVRDFFISATVGQDDIFPDIELPRKIFKGKRKVSVDVAQKILSDLDKERFKKFLSRLGSVESINRLCTAFGIESKDETELHDYIFNAFTEYLEYVVTGDKKTFAIRSFENTQKNIGSLDSSIEPIPLNLNNMRFFASENNGIKVVDIVQEKEKYTVTYNRSIDNSAEPKAFAMIAYIYTKPTSWVDYSRNEYSLVFKGRLSLNINTLILEIKNQYADNAMEIVIEKRIRNNDGQFESRIPLADYDIDKLGSIKEICFTVFNEDCSSIGEQTIEVNQLIIGR